ncbi:sugar phosphate isomerase/epimerase family protein [Halobaculum sp. MBLA0147]|uniref:sugar phosphate isomerase/epimerase family protein n=1 Tax=Halobaculum sp. MBLA0147 TaxID=3079934 RepID=UPI0035243BC1
MEIGAAVGPYLDTATELPEQFAFVEFGLGEGEITREEFAPDAVREVLAETGLDPVVHLPYHQPIATPVPEIDAATAAYVDELCEVAASVGVERAVAHPSARGAGHATETLIDRLAELSDRAAAHGVEVCFETVGYAGGLSLDRVGELATAADVSVCLDVGYAAAEADTEGVVEFLRTRGDRVAHLHVHDVRHRGDTHLPVGSGDVEFDALGPVIAETVSDATASVEVFTDDAEYLATSAERFRAALAGDL